MSELRPVLYAEDDENDAFLMQRAFKQAEIANPLRVMTDGRTAIAYLSGAGEYANREQHPLPCLILLDLKMPGQSGFDVLKWVRSQPSTCTLPIVAITSSNQDSDIHRAYMIGANGYLIKPGAPDKLAAMVRSIKEYWLMQNAPPPPGINLSA